MTVPPLLLSIEQVRLQIGRSRATVYRLIARGALVAVATAPEGSRRPELRVPAESLTEYVKGLTPVVQPAAEPAPRSAARRTRTRRPAKV